MTGELTFSNQVLEIVGTTCTYDHETVDARALWPGAFGSVIASKSGADGIMLLAGCLYCGPCRYSPLPMDTWDDRHDTPEWHFERLAAERPTPSRPMEQRQ